MKNLYIDIDGVLVRGGVAAEGAVEFLRFATENFDCYWLTTHCDGDASRPFLYLVGKLPEEAVQYLEKIKPTSWGSLRKTDGIDFNQPFFWMDDNLFEVEKQALEEKGKLDSYIPIDLNTNPNQLLDLIPFLKKQK